MRAFWRARSLTRVLLTLGPFDKPEGRTWYLHDDLANKRIGMVRQTVGERYLARPAGALPWKDPDTLHDTLDEALEALRVNGPALPAVSNGPVYTTLPNGSRYKTDLVARGE